MGGISQLVSGEWGVENGEWRVESGEYREESGESTEGRERDWQEERVGREDF